MAKSSRQIPRGQGLNGSHDFRLGHGRQFPGPGRIRAFRKNLHRAGAIRADGGQQCLDVRGGDLVQISQIRAHLISGNSPSKKFKTAGPVMALDCKVSDNERRANSGTILGDDIRQVFPAGEQTRLPVEPGNLPPVQPDSKPFGAHHRFTSRRRTWDEGNFPFEGTHRRECHLPRTRSLLAPAGRSCGDWRRSAQPARFGSIRVPAGRP